MNNEENEKNHTSPILKEESEESLEILLQKVIGTDSTNLTERQVDEIISQRSKVYAYVHDERMQKHEEYKLSTQTDLHYFYGLLAFILLMSAIVLYSYPEYFREVLFALLGFAGGFGVGKFRNSGSKGVE